jgi:hypothetical protein
MKEATNSEQSPLLHICRIQRVKEDAVWEELSVTLTRLPDYSKGETGKSRRRKRCHIRQEKGGITGGGDGLWAMKILSGGELESFNSFPPQAGVGVGAYVIKGHVFSYTKLE